MATAADRRIPLRILHALAQHRLPDGELLRRYLAAGDEEAFAEIVRRQGPLVLRACRHVLGETTAAEDAFQATFLLLTRKGRSLTSAGSLAGWLHEAAVRLARDARRADWRRRRRESAAGERAGACPPSEEPMWREVRERLDAELAALPEKYRLPLVLCYLQELSYEEAARRAGCSTGALRGRLERGKRILRQRLARYGLPVAAPVLVLGRPAAVSAALCQATVAALRPGAVPAAVAALAGSTLSLKAKVVALAGALLAACGLAWASQGEPSPGPRAVDPPQAPAAIPPAAQPRRGVDVRGDPLPPGAVARFGTRRFQVSSFPLPVSFRGGNAYLVSYVTGYHWLDAASGKFLDAWQIPLGSVIDLETGKPRGQGSMTSLGLSRDGRWAVFTEPRVFFTGGFRVPVPRAKQEKPDRSFNLHLYDVAARKKVKTLRGQFDEREGPPSHACVSADGKWLACTGAPASVRLWDVTAGKQVWTSMGAGQGAGVIGFTPDNRLVLCGANDEAIIVVDAARAAVIRTFAIGVPYRFVGAQLSPDGATLMLRLAASSDLGFWDVNSGKQLPPLGEPGKRPDAPAFSPDSKTFVYVAQPDGATVIVRDWPSQKVRRRLDLGRAGVSGLSISADNRTLNVMFNREQTLRRYDLESGGPLPVPDDTHRGVVVGVEVAPDGSIVSLGTDRVMRTWDLARRRQTREVPLNFAPADTPFALSRDGKLLAAANSSLSEVVMVDRDGKVVRRIDTSGRRIDRVVFSPSTRFLVGCGCEANVVLVWETATGKTVAVFGAGKVGWWSKTVDVAFSNDERYFVATAPGKLQFWEVNGWRRAKGLGDDGSGMAFSPDSRMMACGSGNETLLWEVPTRKLRVKLGPTGDWNPALRFSPDGRLLARRTSTGAIEVWDVLRGRKVANFQGHEGSVRAFAFTGDGRHVITASDDCTLLAWDLAGAVAAARAGQKAPLR